MIFLGASTPSDTVSLTELPFITGLGRSDADLFLTEPYAYYVHAHDMELTCATFCHKQNTNFGQPQNQTEPAWLEAPEDWILQAQHLSSSTAPVVP